MIRGSEQKAKEDAKAIAARPPILGWTKVLTQVGTIRDLPINEKKERKKQKKKKKKKIYYFALFRERMDVPRARMHGCLLVHVLTIDSSG